VDRGRRGRPGRCRRHGARRGGDIVTAGLVNTHHHLYQWLTRGRAVGRDLFGWLTELYPVWARIDAEDVHAAALVGLGELALTGCTTAADHHYLVPGGDEAVFDAIGEAARTVGIRLHLARGSMDLGTSQGGLPPDHVVEDRDTILASTEPPSPTGGTTASASWSRWRPAARSASPRS
jgi:cytosine/adenosine deaminase-related metal-dependent hydrolase